VGTRENLEVAERAVDAFNRRDTAALVECFDEGVVWFPLPGVPDLTEPAHGPDGVLQMLDRWLEPWDRYESATRELVGEGDVVMWTTHVRASQQASGMELAQDIYAVLDFRDGRIVRTRWFWTKADAVAATGPRVDTSPPR
jgi:ketosteroid isomerase-like protein